MGSFHTWKIQAWQLLVRDDLKRKFYLCISTIKDVFLFIIKLSSKDRIWGVYHWSILFAGFVYLVHYFQFLLPPVLITIISIRIIRGNIFSISNTIQSKRTSLDYISQSIVFWTLWKCLPCRYKGLFKNYIIRF